MASHTRAHTHSLLSLGALVLLLVVSGAPALSSPLHPVPAHLQSTAEQLGRRYRVVEVSESTRLPSSSAAWLSELGGTHRARFEARWEAQEARREEVLARMAKGQVHESHLAEHGGHVSEDVHFPALRVLKLRVASAASAKRDEADAQQDMEIVLERNHALLPESYEALALGDGGRVVGRETRADTPHCHYWGFVASGEGAADAVASAKRRAEAGEDQGELEVRVHDFMSVDNYVAVSTCDGLRGSVVVGGEHFFVESFEDAEELKTRESKVSSSAFEPAAVHGQKHMLYRVADMPKEEGYCGNTADTAGQLRALQEHRAERETQEVLKAAEAADELLEFVNGEDHAHEHEHEHEDQPLHRLHLHKAAGQFDVLAHGTSAPAAVEVLVVNDFVRTSDSRFRYRGNFLPSTMNANSLSILNQAGALYYASRTTFVVEISIVMGRQISWTTEAANIPFTCSDNDIDTKDYTSCSSTGEISSLAYLSNLAFDRGEPTTIRNNPDYFVGTTPHPADQVSIFSGMDFNAGTIGLAYTGAMCYDENVPTTFTTGSGVTILAGTYSQTAAVNQVTHSQAFDASTVAHELGHNLGMCHDPVEGETVESIRDNCPDISSVIAGGFGPCLGKIMSPFATSTVPTEFSPCSAVDNEDYLTDTSSSSDSDCLAQSDTNDVGANTYACGNGALDAGEECDCGADDCDTADKPDHCCDGTTCQLKSGAECSAYQVCCSGFHGNDTCLVLEDTFVCRPAADGDDAAEFCDGTTAECPPDEAAERENFLERYKNEIIVAGVGVALLVVLWKLLHKLGDCICGESTKQRSFRRSATQRSLQLNQRKAGGKGKAIRLPQGWTVRYTKNGIPIYFNKTTGERYDFRTVYAL